ncbi:MAG: DUF1559 domain-containing protein [Pirellulaceae bacterium]|nr:DUF1559 domain-containing protein [Pirellulaceae bacterium]
MPILFTCPHCGRQTDVADQFAGRTGPCAACGQLITIPGPVYLSPASVAEVPERSARGPWGMVWIIAVTAGILLLGVGVPLALILPAIQAAREAARRTQCHNYLTQIGMSLQNYHDTYKVFPMGAMHAGPANESARIGPSWWVGTLPFCEKRNIYNRVIFLQQSGAPGNGAFNAENINANIAGAPLANLVPGYMRCPSCPLPVMESVDGPILLPSYVGISGGCDLWPPSPDYVGDGESAATGLPPPMSGVTIQYRNRRKGPGHTSGGIITPSGMLPPCEHVGLASCTDGTSNTMIVGEQSDWLRDVDPANATRYHGDAGWDTSGTGPAAASTTAGGGFISGTVKFAPVPLDAAGKPSSQISPAGPYDCYNITTVRYPPNYKRVLGTKALPGCSEDHGINNPLQSAHPGGLLVVLVDGSVQFISQTTDLAVLLRLAIRDDGQLVRID